MTKRKADSPAAYIAERRAQAVAAGKCRECMRRKARAGKKTCKPCSVAAGIRRDRFMYGVTREQEDYSGMTTAEVAAVKRDHAVAEGKCSVCRSNPARPNRKTCQVCSDRAALYQQQHAKR